MKSLLIVLLAFGFHAMASDNPEENMPAANMLRHVDSGKDVSLESLFREKGLVVLYFDGITQRLVSCDANDTVQSLEKAYEGEFNFVTVIADTPKRADWRRKNFEGLLSGEFYTDPHGVIAKRFNLSAHAVLLINSKGQIKAVFPTKIPRKEMLKPLHRAISDL